MTLFLNRQFQYEFFVQNDLIKQQYNIFIVDHALINLKFIPKENILSLLEPYLEAIPQVLILLCLWIDNDKYIIGNLNNGFGKDAIIFLFTFSTSVLSSAFGIAKFLKSGPCRLVQNDGLLGGYGQLAFLLLMLSTIFCLIIKGLLLSLACAPWVQFEISTIPAIFIWGSLNCLPQLIFVSKYTYIRITALELGLNNY